MSDSNCNCCGCQYSTPPWWVTMGFVPPNNYQGHVQGTVVQAPPAAGVNPGATKPGAGVKPTAPFRPGNAFGEVLGDTGGAIGTAVGSVLGTPLNIAGGVLSDVVGGLGGLLGKIR